MDSSTFYSSLFSNETSAQRTGVEVNHNYWTPILQEELAKYEVLYTDLIQQQTKFYCKTLEAEMNIKRGRYPTIVQMKPRSLGQFSKFLSLEDISTFKNRSIEIAKRFENEMLSLFMDIRHQTDKKIKEKIDIEAALVKKVVINRLRQAGPSNVSETLQSRIRDDVGQWLSVTVPSTINPIREKLEKKIQDTRIKIETDEKELKERKERQDADMIDEVVMSNKEKISRIVKDILNTSIEKKKKKSSLKKQVKQIKLNQQPIKKSSTNYSFQKKKPQSRLIDNFNSPSQTHSSMKRNNNKKIEGKSFRTLFYANCFKCGQFGHKIHECKSKTFKCFNCNEFGHIAKDCEYDEAHPQQYNSKQFKQINNNRNSKSFKNRTFNNRQQSNEKVIGNPAFKFRRNSRRD
jgi:hypothetical protein